MDSTDCWQNIAWSTYYIICSDMLFRNVIIFVFQYMTGAVMYMFSSLMLAKKWLEVGNMSTGYPGLSVAGNRLVYTFFIAFFQEC